MLARENSSLKAVISQKTRAQEEVLKKSIKAEYCQALVYREMLEAIEGSIHALQQSIEECKKIQLTLTKNRGLACTVMEADCSRDSDATERDLPRTLDPAGSGEKRLGKSSGQLFDRWENK